MADCSAVGTTIDRAARAILGGPSDHEKHVGALLGHAAMVAGNRSGNVGMPLVAPNHLTLPGGPTSRGTVIERNVEQRHLLPANNHPQQQQLPVDMMRVPAHQQIQHQQQQMMHHHQVVAQQAMFQQQQQVMHQQMQIMAAQNNRAMVQSRKQEGQRQSARAARNDLQDWREAEADFLEGLPKGATVEELAAAWADAVNDEEEMLGHDGAVNAASIEELATAWAEAEAEYEKLAGQEMIDEDLANIYQGSAEPQPYEFLNKINESQKTIDRNWMNEGLKQFNNGDLQEAIQSFEMELQQNNMDNATAWRMLGRCHAENDMDPEAIQCLEAAVDRDPYSPETLLALSTSYVNELDHERALKNLKAWFTHNPKYSGLELPTDIYGDGETVEKTSAFEEVKQLLLSALAFDATDAGDVHEALGVVYNVIKDYDAAAASLQKALETRRDDYQLWNKLGATLANGTRSDQALPAYHRALQIKPKYARAWLNMAISHSNLEDHDEAARCYLQTLSLNPGAKHCWAYLRMALSSAERWDLLPLCFEQDVRPFLEHFDFIYDDKKRLLD